MSILAQPFKACCTGRVQSAFHIIPAELFHVNGSHIQIICWQLHRFPGPHKSHPIHTSFKAAFLQSREQRAEIFFCSNCPLSQGISVLLSKNSFLRRELGLQWSKKMCHLSCPLTQKLEEGVCISCSYARLSCKFSIQTCFTSSTLFSLQSREL